MVTENMAEGVGLLFALLVVLIFMFAIVPTPEALYLLGAVVAAVAIALPLIFGSMWVAKKLLCHPKVEEVREE